MHTLLATTEMARADALTIAAGTPGSTLMDRAGRAVADAVARSRRAGARVLVLCGPGNNGGDGFVAARVLKERGYRVALSLLGSRDALKGDAAGAAALWREEAGPLGDADIEGADIIVDALFGAGLARDLDGLARDTVERVNASGKPVVAVDLPSGLDGDSGQIRGASIRAVETVTFFRMKPGHLLFPGRMLCGPVRVADIGIPDDVLDAMSPKQWRNDPALWRAMFRAPALDGHKYGRGHAVVVSGPVDATGAARLAARAALRMGAGLVTVASPAAALQVNAGALTAVMVRASDGVGGLANLLADARKNVLVLGPGAGVGAETREMVAAALAAGPHTVLDADALTSFAGDAEELAVLIAARRNGGPQGVVLTPHEGEFARLFKTLKSVTQPVSKLERCRKAAAAVGAVVLLKGPDTVVAAPDGRAVINANATPWLATAGSGDVLAGFIGGLLAQSVPAFEAACAAAWFHGEAGAAVGPGLIAEDLLDALPEVLKGYFAEG